MALDLQLDRPVSSSIPKTDVSACPACESPDRTEKYNVVEHEYSNTTDDEFTFKECLNCGAWYLDPRPDGRRNEPMYLPHIVQSIAEACPIEILELAASITRTSERFFALP